MNGHSEESRRKELQENRHDKTITEEKGKKGNEPLKQVLTYLAAPGGARCTHQCPNHHKTFPVGIPCILATFFLLAPIQAGAPRLLGVFLLLAEMLWPAMPEHPLHLTPHV